MRPTERFIRFSTIVVAAVGLVMLASGIVGAADPEDVCHAAKLKAAGKKEACLAAEEAKEVLGKPADFAKCSGKFEASFAKAEAKAGAGVCPTEGDAAAIEALIDGCFDDLKAALSGSPNPPCGPGAFPATGQTTCYDSAGTVIACPGTGDDGDIQAGATLSYMDNGDGTITDNNTGLMWEKKSDDGTIHDKGTSHTWANAFAVHIAGLNAGAGFAGHTDWRLPNVKELQSIVNYENFNPSVSPAFHTGCIASCTVLTCSCTVSSFYWSSTTLAIGPSFAWGVNFDNGLVFNVGKTSSNFVRAVRGGS